MIDRSVLVSFVAGPGRARGVQIELGKPIPVEERHKHLVPAGESRNAPITQEDLDLIHFFTASYLEDFSLPAPPDVRRWWVRVPDEVSEDEFIEMIDIADNPPDILDHPVEDSIRRGHAVARIVARVLDVPNPFTER